MVFLSSSNSFTTKAEGYSTANNLTGLVNQLLFKVHVTGLTVTHSVTELVVFFFFKFKSQVIKWSVQRSIHINIFIYVFIVCQIYFINVHMYIHIYCTIT